MPAVAIKNKTVLLFPEDDQPEEIIQSLGNGDIIQMNILRKTKVSDVRIMSIIKSKENFIQWFNMPEPPEEDNIG